MRAPPGREVLSEHVLVLSIRPAPSCRLLEKLKALVTMNENLKQQEQDFRAHCRVSDRTRSFGPFRTAGLTVDVCVSSGGDDAPPAEHRGAEVRFWTGCRGGEGTAGSDPFSFHEQMTEPSDPLLFAAQRGTS